MGNWGSARDLHVCHGILILPYAVGQCEILQAQIMADVPSLQCGISREAMRAGAECCKSDTISINFCNVLICKDKAFE